MRFICIITALLGMANYPSPIAIAAETSVGDKALAAYFRAETQKLADACSSNTSSLDSWAQHRQEYRQQLREMLGLDPLPERTPLDPVITGKLDHHDFTVEKLHFQSRPHLYVTGNLYLPKNVEGRAPGVLYVCGHSKSKKGDVSFGNKTKYQHHGAWFAQNGYVCLVIDTLQLGEIEGIHHGTYREGMWWWNARGYTPAGVEAWISIRALDYLESRPEVDPERLGVTGRSGGGAYSWYLAALDDRVKVAVPVAGITSLKNHVVDGCVEGHCDCMYMVNTYRWDYAQLAALAAPRPLLIANTDRDHIFPLDGVVDIYRQVRNIYELDGKPLDCALQIAAGDHADGQVLQLHALQWFNRHLKGEKEAGPIESAAKSYFEPEDLKVFGQLPKDQLNTRIHESFVPLAIEPSPPTSISEWHDERERWMAALREKCFRAWPNEAEARHTPATPRRIHVAQVNSADVSVFQFTSQDHVELNLYVLEPTNVDRGHLTSVVLQPLDAEGWSRFTLAKRLATARPKLQKSEQVETNGDDLASPGIADPGRTALAFVAPRGIGPTAWSGDDKARASIRRRFMLLGQTLDGMRVWDIRRAIEALRSLDGFAHIPLVLKGEHEMAGLALYAALFEPKIERLELDHLPASHRAGPDFLNVLRYLDVPQAVAMASENSRVLLYHAHADDWKYSRAVAQNLDWNDRLTVNTNQDESAGAPPKPVRALSR